MVAVPSARFSGLWKTTTCTSRATFTVGSSPFFAVHSVRMPSPRSWNVPVMFCGLLSAPHTTFGSTAWGKPQRIFPATVKQFPGEV